MADKTGFFGHPKGLSTLFFTEMWERFSYYGMRAILVLFMTKTAAEGGLGYSDEKSTAIYGLYTAGVYLLTLPGGWIADRLIGTRRSIWYGGLVIMAGHFLMAVPVDIAFFCGLALIVIGTGLLKPNISTIVGELYGEDEPARRDAGFSIFYMGINLGAFFGPLLVGYFGENVNWHLGFALAGIGMGLGLIWYRISAQKNLGDIGLLPNKLDDANEETGSASVGLIFAIATIALIAILQLTKVIDLFTAVGFAEAVGILIFVIIIFYFLYVLFAGGLTSVEKKKVIVIFFLVIGAAMFWSGFEQAGSSLNLFADRYTDKGIFGLTIPTSWFQSVNSFFIIILAPIFGWLWIVLAKKNLNPSTPLKFAFGLLMLGLGFLVMVFAARIAANGMEAAPFYLILTYFLHTAGELALSPRRP